MLVCGTARVLTFDDKDVIPTSSIYDHECLFV